MLKNYFIVKKKNNFLSIILYFLHFNHSFTDFSSFQEDTFCLPDIFRGVQVGVSANTT